MRLPVFLHGGKRETSILQFKVIDDQAAIFHMQGFQGRAMPVNEQEDIPASHILLHVVMYKSTESVKTFPHVGRGWIQPVTHRGVQVKHGYRFKKTSDWR